MLLAIDIGNSNVSLGVFRGEKLLLRAKLSAQAERSADEYTAVLYDQLRLNGVEREQLAGCILSSVVPELTELVEAAVEKLTGLPVLRVGPGVRHRLPYPHRRPLSAGGRSGGGHPGGADGVRARR